MPTRGRRDAPRGYLLQFMGTAALLVAGTLMLVLWVLPERYVLSSGFREGNLSLPSPSIPFEPAPTLRFAALPSVSGPLPVAAEEGRGDITEGVAERFWRAVLPLLDDRRFEEAIPLFTEYLARHPGDVGVRREYAITLAAAGRPEAAVPVLRGLLPHEDDDELRLLLARTLRDAGRVAEASEHYAYLLEGAPDADLALEWARAHAWVRDYEAAEGVLRRGLEAAPESTPLRAELARVHYYAGRIDDAPVDAAPTPPRTLLERAAAAREADDVERADSLFGAALEDDPTSAETWLAYADFLQYELDDLGGAWEALTRAERLGAAGDPALQYRMAQLELWTDRNDAARERLESLLARTPELEAAGAPSRPDVLALLGDLSRWSGERIAAVRRYEDALEADPDHERASEGLRLVRVEVDRAIVEAERPGMGAVASSFADTDDYRRFDAGGLWRGVDGRWAWVTRAGARRIEGLEPPGSEGAREGLFAELEGARWWRLGSVRTAVRLTVQNVRSSSLDAGLGLSLRRSGDAGRRTDVGFDHEPAWLLVGTLQSVAATVWQDRITLAHTRPLSKRWSAAVSAEATSLEHRDAADADRNLRLHVAASVGRPVSSSVTLGLAGRALRYTDAAPAMPIPLYWDPRASVSVGPYARWVRPLDTSWKLSARVAPGVSYIDERRRPGSELAPDLSAGLGLAHDAARYRTRVELFYGQGRFSGYRSFGVDLSFTAVGGPGSGDAVPAGDRRDPGGAP